jgi:hypothetical protein
MPRILQKAQWAAARIVFIIAAFAYAASGTVLGYLLGPLYSWYFLNDLHFLKHRRYFFPMIVCGWRLVAEWIRNPAYRSMFAIPLTAPPMNGPNRLLVHVRTGWLENDDACNGCTQCCTLRCCPMLDAKRNRCISYGSFFWRYFNCGRYPENTEQISFYKCPKWEIGKS